MDSIKRNCLLIICCSILVRTRFLLLARVCLLATRNTNTLVILSVHRRAYMSTARSYARRPDRTQFRFYFLPSDLVGERGSERIAHACHHASRHSAFRSSHIIHATAHQSSAFQRRSIRIRTPKVAALSSLRHPHHGG